MSASSLVLFLVVIASALYAVGGLWYVYLISLGLEASGLSLAEKVESLTQEYGGDRSLRNRLEMLVLRLTPWGWLFLSWPVIAFFVYRAQKEKSGPYS